MLARTKRTTAGRYDLAGVAEPPGGIAKAPKGRAVVVVAVEDPYDPPEVGKTRKRVLAAVNRATDLLEIERSYGRISEGAYRAGRVMQAIYERAAGVRGQGDSDGGRADPALIRDLAMIRALDNAETIVFLVTEVGRVIGRMDAAILRDVIGDGLSFADVAAKRGMRGRNAPDSRNARYMAARFRDGLEAVSDEWSRRGSVFGS